MTQGSRTILVVEDQPEARSLLNTMLENAGFEVIVAGDGGAGALHQLWKRSGNLALLVTDIDMGRMNGVKLAEMLRSQYPVVPILLISGLPVPADRRRKGRSGDFSPREAIRSGSAHSSRQKGNRRSKLISLSGCTSTSKGVMTS